MTAMSERALVYMEDSFAHRTLIVAGTIFDPYPRPRHGFSVFMVVYRWRYSSSMRLWL